MDSHIRVKVDDSSGVGEARRVARTLAAELGFDDVEVGEVGIVVTEAASNLIKHAGRGEILLRALREGPDLESADSGLELLALDRGPGIADFAIAGRDGWSSTGSLGLGLGTIARLSALSEFYSHGGGLALLAQLRVTKREDTARRALEFQVGGLSVCHPAETICGDGWACQRSGPKLRVFVVDGLGHGRDAAKASAAALEAFGTTRDLATTTAIDRIHGALRPTRGAAATLVELDLDRKLVRSCGVGNVSSTVLSNLSARHLVSHNGTLGHGAVKLQEFQSPWPEDGLLVVHSDGLQTRWNLEGYPGLAARHPGLLAGVLYRDFARGNDDVTVVAVKVVSS